MKRNISALFAAGLALVVTGVVAVPSAWAQVSEGKAKARQRDKNNMRNLGTVLGAAAAHQIIKGKTTNALVLGAGAAYSAKKYEDARKAQARENHPRVGRVYRYQNGRRIGYYKVVNGRRMGYYPLRSARR
jgi:hypothetical protein